jgi:hypothetical protein
MAHFVSTCDSLYILFTEVIIMHKYSKKIRDLDRESDLFSWTILSAHKYTSLLFDKDFSSLPLTRECFGEISQELLESKINGSGFYL